MIVDERMRTYINSLDMGNTPFLENLEQYAIKERVPIIRREMQSFMKMFLALNQPKRILEVGTAIGFSTLLMCEYGPKDLSSGPYNVDEFGSIKRPRARWAYRLRPWLRR